MKKTLIKSAVAIHLLLLLNVTTTHAQTIETSQSEMKATGKMNNEPVYEIRINNTLPGTYTFFVSDENGIPLYEETLSGSNIKRRFLLNKNELGSTGVVFEVFNGRTKEAVYAVKYNYITTEHLFVTAKK